jgi:hypothetical protein
MDLDSIDIIDQDQYVVGVPHDSFALLRREAPVFWHEEPDRLHPAHGRSARGENRLASEPYP